MYNCIIGTLHWESARKGEGAGAYDELEVQFIAENPMKACFLLSIFLIAPPGAFSQDRKAGAVRYTISCDAESLLTSITIKHESAVRIYNPEKLICAEIVHFRSSGRVNLAHGAGGTDLSEADRRRLLDRRLTCGVPNPGAAVHPLKSSPIVSGNKTTPGLGVRFDPPLVNRAGPDLVLFELQKQNGADPFHVAPLESASGLHALTVRHYDISAGDSEALDVGPVSLYNFSSPPSNLTQFTRTALTQHSAGETGFRAVCVAIDLSRLGYREGRSVPGLFFQSAAGAASFDPVAILGLPAPSPGNLLAREPMATPKRFTPVVTGLLKKAWDGPLAGCDEIIFAQRVSGRDHWYGNFGHYCETDSHYSNAALIKTPDMRYAFGEGGRLCRFNLRTGELSVFLDDPRGGIRDPKVHYSGKKILFSYRKGGTKTYHLYEINSDGSNLKQLTFGPDNDIEPVYTPDGGIVFCSSRCHRFVPCWRTQVAVLYRCDADGRNIRMISSNAEQENTPWMLPDGRVLYTRWEYVDRNQLLYHHLWTVNPDGTNVMVYFGNQHNGLVMIDAKPIPGSNKVIVSFSPGHGRAEHMGEITVIDPSNGPDDMSRARPVTKRHFRDPYPLSEELFLVADNAGIHLLDAAGRTQVIFPQRQRGARWSCHEPRLLRAGIPERTIPHKTEIDERSGRLILYDIYQGRNMKGVKPGEIKKLLVLEQLPKPANFSGGQEPLTIGGSFTLERILGTVPVEDDGSAYMELPAVRSVFFVALDRNDLAVKRMQSFVTVQPGEVTGCVGCHEPRTQTPNVRLKSAPLAVLRAPSRPRRVLDNVPDVLDYSRDVQPVFDRHCVRCHNPSRRDGKVDLCGDRTPLYTTSYWTMFVHNLVSDGRNGHGNRAPREVGSSASRLLTFLSGSHYDVTVSAREQAIVRLWIESGATYPGTYAALGSGMHPVKFPEQVMKRRCSSCHTATKPTYRNLKKGAFYFQFGDRQPPQPLLSDIDDIILIRHLAYFQLGESPLYQALCNLDRAEKSLILQAPLSKTSGGLQLCTGQVFKDTSDPDYQTILHAIEDAAAELARHKRFDMPGFRPNRFYIREMQHFGILPKELTFDAPLDPYALDQAYWASFEEQVFQRPQVHSHNTQK